MGDDTSNGVISTIVQAGKDKNHPLFGFALIISIAAAFAVFMAFPFVVMAIVSTGGDVVTGKKPVQSLWRNCYDFKEIGGTVFKVDQCSGKMEPYKTENGK